MWSLAVNRITFPSLTLGVVLCSAGCAFAYSAGPQAEQTNTCSSDAECGDGAVCQANACLSTEVDLHGLIVEVRPNSSASFGPSTSFLLTPDDRLVQGSSPGGVENHFDSKLPAPISISGEKIKLDYAYDCPAGVDGSYPANLTLERVTPYLGFHFDPIVLKPKKIDAAGGSTFAFDDQVTPGVYNVYIEPQPLAGCATPPPPPIFYPNQDLTRQSPTWTIPKQLPLIGAIQTPNGGDLTDWRLDIVEPDVGRVISTTQTLKQKALAFTVDVSLDFIWPDKSISPYIRLRPPEGVNKPTVYWDLLAALVGSSPGKPEVHLTVANLVIKPRPVEIQIQDSMTHGVPSEVKVQSLQLSGEVAANATFGLEIPQTSPEGIWKADLPPGTYRIRVTPLVDNTLATTETDVEIPAVDPSQPGDGCFCGHVITVGMRAVLSGNVATMSGAPFVDAPIAFEPSQTTSISFWNSVHALDPLLPRSTSAVSDPSGGFQINVDPGASDFYVRPSDASGFPWLVWPRVTVQVTDVAVDLAQRKLPAPALLEGTFTDPAGLPVANAYVHAWLPVHDPKQNNGLTGTVIQVAATTTDAVGHYKLVLPASISQ